MRSTEPRSAWSRLVVAFVLSTIGSSGFWSMVVALPAIGSAFAVDRADASLAYTATMVGYAAGTLVMARLADRVGIVRPLAAGSVMLGVGYVAAGIAPSLATFMLAQGLLVGIGSASVFTPLVAHVSLWFTRRRGLAIAICASGNTLAGAVWPPVMEHFFDAIGWRPSFILLGVFCLVTMPPLILALRGAAPLPSSGPAPVGGGAIAALGLGPRRLHLVLVAAGVMCCIAMSVPQVHLVAYCRDLGYGATRGADMLSLMLGASLLSRVGFGWSADRIGGLANLLLGSAMQAGALVLYALFTGLDALYAISALFGLVQSGIIPSYAVIVREYFPAGEAATRLAPIAVANFAGMSLGAWMAGAIFDRTGSYQPAFLNGVAWNAVNIAIVAWLLLRLLRRSGTKGSAAQIPR